MRSIRYTVFSVLLFILCQASIPSYGQLGISFDLKKPKEFDERVLRSEKSDQKKFNLPNRFIQNTVTHYNYVFNAKNKLNSVIDRAKSSFREDYSKLLPFYNYTLDATARDKVQLDSVIYKSETGIALHDLRNDWVDNLYLLWGAAYYLRKEFDSAYLMFQFINYAFADKEKDGYYKTIGSSMDGNKAFSISTKEKTSLTKKIFSEPPSRNDAFIWQIRNFLAQDEFAEAASLIVTLKNDPNFPERLHGDLEEVQAWWFYKQNMWDSAAPHLVNALDNATNKQERARWEYLVAQLYELSGKYKDAQKYYARAIVHTIDPVLDVYARLNSIRVNRDSSSNYIDKNVAELLKMAKRDRYEEYRDIIYYMAAQMELQQNNSDAAYTLLQKSVKYNSGNIERRNKAFLTLAEMAFSKKLYRDASNFYDSLELRDSTLPNIEQIMHRKEFLGKLATDIEIIERQDSLQRIAAMPEDERKSLVKKLVKQLRKMQGLKDEKYVAGPQPFAQQNTSSLFSNSADSKGDWYFYNSDAKTKGYNDFISTWGKRPNVDNWRRSSTISGVSAKTGQLVTDNGTNQVKKTGNNTDNEITFENLYDKIPLTSPKMKVSNDSISTAMFELGKLYAQEVEDCNSSVETFENLRKRFPEFEKMDEVLFNLYYCYNKNGETAKAQQIKELMNSKYPKSNFTTIVVTGRNPESKNANPDATKEYEKIYDLFIEGNFKEAVEQKKIADSIYGKNYWTPQLLYIEAVYYVKQRNDSTATRILNSIITQFPKTPLADRAATLIDVLSRRNQIETELRNLVIKKPKEEEVTTNKPSNTIVKNTTADTTAATSIVKNRPIDTTAAPTTITTIPKSIQPQIVAKKLMDTTASATIVKNKLIDTAAAPATITTIPKSIQPQVVAKKPTDTIAAKPVQQPSANSYTFVPDAPYYVMIVLTKVDPIFSGEAKNAFFRYNMENYYNKSMTTNLVDLDAESKLLLIGSFKNSQDAVDYVDHIRPLTSTEIIPWLKGGKYYFLIITDKNLEILQSSKDLNAYKQFLDKNIPGKF